MANWAGSFSVAPTTRAPIVREHVDESGEVQRELAIARCDWPKPPGRPGGTPIINARMEKLAERFWVGAFSLSRCIVPMNGYYEWTGTKSPKTAHFLQGDELLAAGLTWTVNVDGDRQRVFVVVTREARDAGGEIHDRMPAFLERDLWNEWLNPAPLTVKGDTESSKQNRTNLQLELEASSAAVVSTIRTHVVDSKVNNTRTVDPSDPTLIEPLGA